MPHQCSDPTAEERRREVAKLLATGLLRYHRRVRPALPAPSESAQNQLDECSASRPSRRLYTCASRRVERDLCDADALPPLPRPRRICLARRQSRRPCAEPVGRRIQSEDVARLAEESGAAPRTPAASGRRPPPRRRRYPRRGTRRTGCRRPRQSSRTGRCRTLRTWRQGSRRGRRLGDLAAPSKSIRHRCGVVLGRFTSMSSGDGAWECATGRGPTEAPPRCTRVGRQLLPPPACRERAAISGSVTPGPPCGDRGPRAVAGSN